jgi:uncharacterized protein
MIFEPAEVVETIRMVTQLGLDVRTVTLGINIADCAADDAGELGRRVYEKVTRQAGGLVGVADALASRYGVPIVNTRVAVSAVGLVGQSSQGDLADVARAMDKAAADIGIDFIGGYSCYVHKGVTPGDERLLASLPEALSQTERVCASVSVASTKAGINIDAVSRMGSLIREIAARTAERDGVGCAKLVVFSNICEDNPFMAGAVHGPGEGEAVVNIGISGPGVVRAAVAEAGDLSLTDLADLIKRTAFKISRVGELVGREAAAALGAEFGIVDLSLAPTPAPGDSVAGVLEAMGVESAGSHGTVAALAMLNDAVKKGGAMATSSTGGLSGAFIPVSEDAGMVAALGRGTLTLERLESMLSVCSVGLDMIALPGDTPAATLAAIIADTMAIGVINDKTTATRLIPVPGKGPGEIAEFGGLLGAAPILAIDFRAADLLLARGGRIPPPLRSLGN